MQHGDFWDQKRGEGGWQRQHAEKFVGCGWAPSMIVMKTAGDVVVKAARDGA